MAMEDLLESIQNFDIDQLNDVNNVGSWPMAIKVIIWVLAFVGALALGYFLHVTNLQKELGGVTAQEGALKEDYQKKFFEAAHLEAYRLQQKEMEESFEAILRQLPSDTEIPGLIEDITLVGLKNGLTFTSIDLQPEAAHEFYVEKPIRIIVTGSYHGIGSFVSDVADLSRIVTLHDFTISPQARGAGSDSPGSHLNMVILAKTYRYNDERG
ncbi:MAG: type 4a pilus biogenesis protein PilO [Gammaproteobacteria bacterium]|jgi:type IV pilus assembly protein PilO|nr:type 4a pilus biogenesis protein PilO [Gammaproteobacteria bacterium]MBT4493467.1 type 4a pilus biogenesis protein PilO [Gammaproteobacteria bacterium]